MTSSTAARPRREQLLQCAADLFSARGYHAVGIDDIGAAAGISGPGVYRHFPGKQALLAALCDRVAVLGDGRVVETLGPGALDADTIAAAVLRSGGRGGSGSSVSSGPSGPSGSGGTAEEAR